MPTNEELLALLQKIHEIAREGYDANKDAGGEYEEDFEVGQRDAYQEILKVIEPAGFTSVPITVGDRMPCPNCKTDLYLLAHCDNPQPREYWWQVYCSKCNLTGPWSDGGFEEDWNRMVKEMQHASETN